MHEPDAVLELRRFMLLRGLERAAEVVEDADYEVIDEEQEAPKA